MISIFNTKHREINTIYNYAICSCRYDTHLLGETLCSNPNTEVLIKYPHFFYPITELTIKLDTNKDNLKKDIRFKYIEQENNCLSPTSS